MIAKILKGAPYAVPLFRALAAGREIGFSFNLTDRCPINCNCYWRAMERVPELGKDNHEAVQGFFRARRDEGKYLATIVGGEPYVNPKLLRKVVEIMPANWVVTSGTAPLMVLPKTTHFVSVDGKDAETHDAIRGSKGLFNRIVANLYHYRQLGGKQVYIHTVLNKLNYRQVEDIVAYWHDDKLADGILFSTMTPITKPAPALGDPLPILHESDGDLRLDRREREWVVRELLLAKRVDPDFICMTDKMIQCFHPDFTEKLSPEICGTSRLVASYDAAGNRIPQCILSDMADCRSCGCVITSFFDAVWRFPPDIHTLRVLARLYTP